MMTTWSIWISSREKCLLRLWNRIGVVRPTVRLFWLSRLMKYVQIQLLGSLKYKVWRDVFNKTHFLLDPSPHHHHHQVIVLIIISLHVRRLVGPGKAVVPLNLELVSLAGLPTHCHHHHLLQSSSSSTLLPSSSSSTRSLSSSSYNWHVDVSKHRTCRLYTRALTAGEELSSKRKAHEILNKHL